VPILKRFEPEAAKPPETSEDAKRPQLERELPIAARVRELVASGSQESYLGRIAGP